MSTLTPTRSLAGMLAGSACLALSSLVSAQAVVDSSASFATGSQPDGAAIGEFTGDGFADIATTIDGPDRIQILVGDGAGSFTPGATFALGANAGGGGIVALDIDNDGDLDLAALLQNQSKVSIFRNNGGGSFALAGSVTTGANPRGARVGDFDLDGDMDIVVANRDSDSASVLVNDSTGAFSAITFASGPDPRGAAFGDYDSDGDLDVAVSCHDDRTVRLHRNNGNGTFSPMLTLNVSSTVRPEGIDSADLNGDALADIAVATSGDALSFATVFLRNGATFSGPFNYSTGGVDAAYLVIADLECDGDADVAVVNESSNNVSLMANNGSGAFGAPTIVATGVNPQSVGAGDVDGDNDNDIAVANKDSNTMTVVETGCGTVTPVCGNGVCEAGEGIDCIDCQGPGGGNPGPDPIFTFDLASLIVGTQPDGVAAVDVEGDGDLDLAITVDGPDRVQLLMNDGGVFTLGNVIALPNAGAGAIVATDLDNDTVIDLAVAMHNGNFIQLLRHTRGSFTSMGTIPTGANPRGLTAGDADGDGKMDLAVANRDADTATFARNLGGFAFSTQTLAVGPDPRGATFAHSAAGTALQLAVTGHDNRSVSVFSWDGISYVLATTLFTGGQVRPEGIDAADLNGDGLEDLVAATNGDAPALNSITVFMANRGGFAAPTFYVTDGLETSYVTLADFDCDDDIDAATTNRVSGDVSVLTNSGTGVFGPAKLFAAGTTPETIIAADFTGDGEADIAVANRDSNNVTIMLNTTCLPPANPADLNGDGAVDASDLAIMLGAWGTPGADLNGDGTTNGKDLAMLLGAWG